MREKVNFQLQNFRIWLLSLEWPSLVYFSTHDNRASFKQQKKLKTRQHRKERGKKEKIPDLFQKKKKKKKKKQVRAHTFWHGDPCAVTFVYSKTKTRFICHWKLIYGAKNAFISRFHGNNFVQDFFFQTHPSFWSFFYNRWLLIKSNGIVSADIVENQKIANFWVFCRYFIKTCCILENNDQKTLNLAISMYFHILSAAKA